MRVHIPDASGFAPGQLIDGDGAHLPYPESMGGEWGFSSRRAAGTEVALFEVWRLFQNPAATFLTAVYWMMIFALLVPLFLVFHRRSGSVLGIAVAVFLALGAGFLVYAGAIFWLVSGPVIWFPLITCVMGFCRCGGFGCHCSIKRSG